MNLSPNFINKLVLKEAVYPDSNITTYFIEQKRIDEILAQELLPSIEITDEEYLENKPKVAILLTRDKHPSRENPDYTIPMSLVSSIKLSGGIPCFMIYERIEEQLEFIKPNGILLPGGDFALPQQWLEQEAVHPKNLQRCEAYIACLRYAKQNKLPLLGICAGMQMLCGFCGGKIKKVDNHRGIINHFAHSISIKKDSLLSSITNLTSAEVNSNHSEAISNDNIGDCVISAVSSDNVIEAIEVKNPWHHFVLGIQSHPEYFVKEKDVFSVRIFNSFIEACNHE